jgi:cell division septal protein FtsQ
MNPLRRQRTHRRQSRTRAERKAELRRARAMSHLQRVRGQAAPRHAPRALLGTGAALATVAGIVAGLVLARGSDWLAPDAPLAGISVIGAKRLGVVDIAAAAGIGPDALCAEVSLPEVVRRLEEHIWITGARAIGLPGGRLLLGVEERVPAAIIAVADSDQLTFADADGTPFANAEGASDPALTRIVTLDAPTPLEPHAEIATAIRIARSLPDYGLGPATEIELARADDPEGLRLRLSGVAPRFVLGREDLDSRLQQLARLLATGAPEVAEASEIDLRFAEQAVLRNEPPPEEAASSGGGARMRSAVHSIDRPGDPAARLTGG